jgi:3-hydroxyisobutyrate dehydrogenase-like beta-hydroxyacid dehydrogenase
MEREPGTEVGGITAIGFVGLGAMGGRIAGRLIAAGHQVYGTNRTKARAAPLVERGLVWCDTPRAVAEAADVVFSMVTDDAALEAIASGSDGVLAGLGSGKVWVDMSTVSPAASAALPDRVRALGAAMLDAPVSGSVHEAEGGGLTIMVGGDEAAFANVEPVLRELGSIVRRIGTNGQGVRLKLAVNISLAAQMLAFSEGVLLAERGGIERELAVEVIGESSVGSPFLRARSPLVLDLPDEPWFESTSRTRTSGSRLPRGSMTTSRFPRRRSPMGGSRGPARSATATATSHPCSRCSHGREQGKRPRSRSRGSTLGLPRIGHAKSNVRAPFPRGCG